MKYIRQYFDGHPETLLAIALFFVVGVVLSLGYGYVASIKKDDGKTPRAELLSLSPASCLKKYLSSLALRLLSFKEGFGLIGRVIGFSARCAIWLLDACISSGVSSNSREKSPSSTDVAKESKSTNDDWPARRKNIAFRVIFKGQPMQGGYLPKMGSAGGAFNYRVEHGATVLYAGTIGSVKQWDVTGSGYAQILWLKGVDRNQHNVRGTTVDHYNNY